MSRMLNLKKIGNEDGLISIVATLIIMSLLTLIALSFVRLASREQRQALDQQLNTQAFYAAESGINDAIQTGLGTCTPQQLGSDSTVATSCVLVTDQIDNLDYTDTSPNGSVVVPIQPTAAMRELDISWEGSPTGDFVNNCSHNLLDATNWGNNAPLLRIMLFPSNVAAAPSGRAKLINDMQTLLLYPSSDTTCNDTYNVPNNDDFTKKGEFVDGHCGAPSSGKYACNIKITGINIPAGAPNKYYLRLRPIYKSAKINIMGKDAAGNSVQFVGAQREIDSTGRTSDVLRRLVVHVPLTDSSSDVNYAVESTNSLCKRLFVSDTGASAQGVSGLDGATTSPYGACVPNYVWP